MASASTTAKPMNSIGVILGLFIYFLEVLIQILQAYIFTLLFAVYVQGSLQEGH